MLSIQTFRDDATKHELTITYASFKTIQGALFIQQVQLL